MTALVNEDKDKQFIEALKQKKIEYESKETDSTIDLIEKQLKQKTNSRIDEFDYNTFHPIDEIYEELERLTNVWPNKVSVTSIGKSFEGRDIKSIKLFGEPLTEKIVVIECGIYGSKWISQAFCMCTIRKLVNNHRLLKDYEFIIIPVLNPDGSVLQM